MALLQRNQLEKLTNMRKKIIYFTFLSVIFTHCQNKNSDKMSVEKQTIHSNKALDKNEIKEILKKQEKLDNEETEGQYLLSQKDLDFLSDLTLSDLKNKGYKEPLSDEFNTKIKTVFSPDYNCIEFEKIGSRYTVFHGNILDGSKKTLTENLYESSAETGNLFFDQQNHIVLNFMLLKSIAKKKGDQISVNIPQLVTARNKYIFNNDAASFTWLKLNDQPFLESLVKTFGYVKDEKLVSYVLGKNLDDKNELRKITWNAKCSGKKVFNKEVMNAVAKLSTEQKQKYFATVEKIIYSEIRKEDSVLNGQFSEKAEMLGKLAYYSTKMGEPYEKYYAFFKMLNADDERIEYEKEFKKSNYYNLPDFKEIWDETKNGGISLPGME